MIGLVVAGCASTKPNATATATEATETTPVQITSLVPATTSKPEPTETTVAGGHDMASMGTDPMAAMDDGAMVTTDATSPTANGYTLRLDQPTTEASADKQLSFLIATADSTPLTTYQVEQTKQLHLIVVRADLSGYQHLHPTLGADGHWSTPVDVRNPGRWRIIADFTPIADTKPGARIALGTDLLVNGAGTDQTTPTPSSAVNTDGYEVTMSADEVKAGTSGPVTFTITKNGVNVTDLLPYLGSFGHLVAIRATDLGYLHLHPSAVAPGAVATAGPTVQFQADIPTTGLHGLYFQFATASGVHTATFALEVP